MNRSGAVRPSIGIIQRRIALRPWALCGLFLAALTPDVAQGAPASTRLHSDIQLSFDCQRPWNVRNYGARATFEAVLNGDGTATADLTLSGFALASTVHFDARLGRGSRPAPGGSAQLRVVSSSALRGIWSLPNNNLVIDIATSGTSCSVAVSFALKPGQKEYSLWGGNKFYYCSTARVLQTTCSAR